MGEEKRAGVRPVGWAAFLFIPPASQSFTASSRLSDSQRRCKLTPSHLPVSVRCSVIEEANWLTLAEDVQKPGQGFDAVICLGNSFAHLPDFKGTSEGEMRLFGNRFLLLDLSQCSDNFGSILENKHSQTRCSCEIDLRRHPLWLLHQGALTTSSKT